MAMKHLKAVVDTFQTRTYQHNDTTLFEITKGKKVVATLGQAGPTSIFIWKGKPLNGKGEFKMNGRTTSWNNAGIDFAVECDRLLYRAVAQELIDQAQSFF